MIPTKGHSGWSRAQATPRLPRRSSSRAHARGVGALAAREWRALRERELSYRGERPGPGIWGRTVILVDDGMATAATLRAAVQALNEEHPKRLIAAVPVAPPETYDNELHQIVCAPMPTVFHGASQWYKDSSQATNEEVRELLGRTTWLASRA